MLRLECTVCKTKAQLALKRCKHFELGYVSQCNALRVDYVITDGEPFLVVIRRRRGRRWCFSFEGGSFIQEELGDVNLVRHESNRLKPQSYHTPYTGSVCVLYCRVSTAVSIKIPARSRYPNTPFIPSTKYMPRTPPLIPPSPPPYKSSPRLHPTILISHFPITHNTYRQRAQRLPSFPPVPRNTPPSPTLASQRKTESTNHEAGDSTSMSISYPALAPRYPIATLEHPVISRSPPGLLSSLSPLPSFSKKPFPSLIPPSPFHPPLPPSPSRVSAPPSRRVCLYIYSVYSRVSKQWRSNGFAISLPPFYFTAV